MPLRPVKNPLLVKNQALPKVLLPVKNRVLPKTPLPVKNRALPKVLLPVKNRALPKALPPVKNRALPKALPPVKNRVLPKAPQPVKALLVRVLAKNLPVRALVNSPLLTVRLATWLAISRVWPAAFRLLKKNVQHTWVNGLKLAR